MLCLVDRQGVCFSEYLLEELFGFLENIFRYLHCPVLGFTVDLDRFVGYFLCCLNCSFFSIAIDFDRLISHLLSSLNSAFLSLAVHFD